ncbi:hypothetical protein CR513_19479, partial [Mucuna pruriens]
MVDSLLYLAASRLDIMFNVCLCAQFQSDPKESHLTTVKCIFRYLKDITNLDRIARKNSSGGCHFIRSSKMQGTIALSIAEAYIENQLVDKLVHIKNLLVGLSFQRTFSVSKDVLNVHRVTCRPKDTPSVHRVTRCPKDIPDVHRNTHFPKEILHPYRSSLFKKKAQRP